MSDDQLLSAQDLSEQGFFVVGSTTHAETGGFEANLRRIKMRLFTGLGYALLNRSGKLGATFRGAYMVARSATAGAEDTAGFIADQRCRAGLAPVHAKKEGSPTSEIRNLKSEIHLSIQPVEPCSIVFA